MTQKSASPTGATESTRSDAWKVRIPGFIVDQEIGLGDAIARASAFLGIRPCGGCSARAEAFNRRVVLTGPRMRK